MSNQSERWLTIRQAALELNVSDLTIRRRIKDRRIAYRLQDGKYYVNLAAPAPASTQATEPIGRNSTTAIEISEPGRTSVKPPLDLAALLPEYGRLAEEAGKAAVLGDQLRQLEQRYAELQQSSLILATRNGWLESKLEEREQEVKLLTDSRRRKSWWRRLFAAAGLD